MNKSFEFDGPMSREVLNNYLSRAVTHIGLGYDNNLYSETFEDDLRMLKSEGAKFIGRAVYTWMSSLKDDVDHFEFTKKRLERGHEVDPVFIFQACVFECVYRPYINKVKIPTYVFEAFGLEDENRCFDYDKMVFPTEHDAEWGAKETGTPDITNIEAKMWFYYRSCEYIKAGCEAIHMGQVNRIGANDPDFENWKIVINMIRDFASKHARRHNVLIDAHTLNKQRQYDLFDYNAFPIRLKEIPDEPQHVMLEEGYLDSMFNDKDGFCKPFLVELDNFGISPYPDKATIDEHYAWGYDEITWYARQPKEYRHEFLRYAYNWIKERYPEGWLEMPSRRCLTGYSRYNYSANIPSDIIPYGWGDEDVVKELFSM